MTSVPPGAPSANRRRRYRLVAALTAVLLLAVVPSAYAYWTATSTGPYARAQASTLPTPTLTSSPVNHTSVALTWTRPFTPTGYTLSQSPGFLAGCSGAPAPGATGCTATGLANNTTYTWTLTASLHNWVAPVTVTATTAQRGTTTTLSNVTPTSATQGTGFSATAAVSRNSGQGTPAGSVVFSLYTSSTCSGTAAATSTQPLSGATASATLQPAPGTYYWRAAYTPSNSSDLASTSNCSAAVTVTLPGQYAGKEEVTRGASTSNVNVPYPSGTSAGDLMLLVVVNNDPDGSATIAGSSHGWTLVANPADDSMRTTAWWHTAGTENSVLLSQLNTNLFGATAWVLRYQNLPYPVQAGVSAAAPGSGTTMTPAALTPTAAATTVISLAATNAQHTFGLALEQERGFGRRMTQSVGVLGIGRSFGVADRFVTTAGSLTPPTWSHDLLTGEHWTYITVAFTSRAP